MKLLIEKCVLSNYPCGKDGVVPSLRPRAYTRTLLEYQIISFFRFVDYPRLLLVICDQVGDEIGAPPV